MTISLKLLLQIFLTVWAVAMVEVYVLKGDGDIFDFYTLCLSLGIGLTLFIALSLASTNQLLVQVFVITLYIIQYFLPRLLFYQLFPNQLEFNYGEDLDPKFVNDGLLYILMGTLAILAGFFFADQYSKKIPRQKEKIKKKWNLPAGQGLFLIFLLSSLADLYMTIVLRVVPSNHVKSENHYLLMGIRTLISTDTSFFLLLACLLFKNLKTTGERIILTLSTVIYSLQMTLLGSKGALLRIGLMFLILAISRYGNIRVKALKLIFIMSIMMALGVVGYGVGLASRMWLAADVVAEGPSSQSIEVGQEALSHSTISDLLLMIVDRLGIIDYPISIISRVETHAPNPYMSLNYVFKSFFNIILPGAPFPEVAHPTAQVLGVIYGSFEEEALDNTFNSEPWTIWGVTYAFFGWAGGLLVLFISAFTLHFFYTHLSSSLSSDFLLLFQSNYFFWAMMGSYYNNMGLDYASGTLIMVILQIIVVCLLGHLANSFIKKFKSFFSKPNAALCGNTNTP